MPLWRYKNVIYNPNYGFMRRLKLIVSAENQIEYGAITEVISLSKQDLQTLQDDIIYQACIGVLSGNYFIYDIALDNPFFTRKPTERTESTGDCWELGSSDAGNSCVTYLLCTDDFIDFYFSISISPGNCPRSQDEPPSGGSNGGANNTPPPNTPTPPNNNTPTPGTGGEPSTGGGGTGGGNGNISGIYPGSTFPGGLADPRNPIYSTPPAQNPQIDYGDNTSPNLPHQPSPLLTSITKQKADGSYDFGNLSNEEIKKLDETITLINSNSPLMAKVFEELASHKLSWGAFSNPNSGTNATYTNGDKTIRFNRARGEDDVLVPKQPYSLVEELLHAFQHKFYGANFTSIPLSNIEFEAKFLRDLMRIHFEKAGGDYHLANKLFDRVGTAIPDRNNKSRYRRYIEKLTESIPPYVPSLPNTPIKLMNVSIGNQNIDYWDIMEDFRNYWQYVNPPYAVAPDTNQYPELLFWLANNCNCTYKTLKN